MVCLIGPYRSMNRSFTIIAVSAAVTSAQLAPYTFNDEDITP